MEGCTVGVREEVRQWPGTERCGMTVGFGLMALPVGAVCKAGFDMTI